MANSKITRSPCDDREKRKRILVTPEDIKAQRNDTAVRNYLGVGGKLWVVTRHVFPVSHGANEFLHEEFVFADKSMAKVARNVMINDIMMHYIERKYNAGDICTSTDEDDCRCQSCGDPHRIWLDQDPVAYAEEFFPDAMEYIETGMDCSGPYIHMTEWKPPVMLWTLTENIPLAYSSDITKTSAYEKYCRAGYIEAKLHDFHVMEIISYTPAQQQTLGLDTSLELTGDNKEEWRNVFLGIAREEGDAVNILGKLVGYSNKHTRAVTLHYPLEEDVCIEVFVFDNAIRFCLQDRYK